MVTFISATSWSTTPYQTPATATIKTHPAHKTVQLERASLKGWWREALHLTQSKQICLADMDDDGDEYMYVWNWFAEQSDDECC